MYLSFNPQYYLKQDSGRVLILASQVGRENLSPIGDNFETIVHPIYAMILSFFDGRDEETILNDIETTLKIKREKIISLIHTLIGNSKYVRIKCNEGISVFPPYTIIKKNEYLYNKRFGWLQFGYENVDLKIKRHLTPTSITLMVNNICYTNCYYCYADKRRKVTCSIPLDRIVELIHEAKQLNVRTFDVIGGEFFLFKNWDKVLSELHKCGYHPYLSTKLPLNEPVVKKLAKMQIQDIQVSLDSLIAEHLTRSLDVKIDYIQKIKETITLLDKYNISIYIHTVLSKETESIEDIQSIYEFIKDVKNIAEWKIDKAGKSLYANTDYSKIEVNTTAVDKIATYIGTIEDHAPFPIRAPRPMTANQLIASKSTFNFFDRGFCSGNYSSMFILPDGNVTMCEELYWIKRFHIGNVLNNSIQEIWNSESAFSLYHLKQESIPSDSLCSSCSDFVKCRSLKQVCYKEVIKHYGVSKWYYPDINCPYTKKQEL